MQQVAAELNVNPFVCFNTEVLSLTWDEPNSSWVIRIRHLPTGVENNVRADFVILGAGPLSLPKMPKIQGIEKFQGRQCHTAQWDQGLVLDGKKVVLVGTGASGLQVVEAITDKVKELTIFQQSPSWVVPRNATVLTSRMKWALKNIPLFAKLMRAYVFLLVGAPPHLCVVIPRPTFDFPVRHIRLCLAQARRPDAAQQAQPPSP